MNDNTPNLYPNDLTEAEYRELALLSAIHPALIERNFIHIEGDTVYSYLFISDQIPRKNAGRVTDGFLKRYTSATLGGIWISGLDPLNNWQPMEWGRFKPTHPRFDVEKGKSVKYESPPKTPNRVTYFDVPDCIWDLVAQRYNIKRYHSPLALRLQDFSPKRSGRWGDGEMGRWGDGESSTSSPPTPYPLLPTLLFWEWVQQHPEIPVILCEGEKKAASLLSLGFVAVALPGIWNGRVGRQDFDEKLHPDLMPLAQKGRKFIILFDYETKLKTRWSVFQAIVRTGKTIEAVGCACEVALLPGPEKGVDDFVVERGEEANALLTAIINDATCLKDYRCSFFISHRGLSRKYTPHLTVNVKYLTQALSIQSDRGLAIGDRGFGRGSEQGSRSQGENPHNSFEHPTPFSPYPQRGHRVPLPPIPYLPLSGLVVLWSDMGTGKTELMRQWRQKNPGKRFLNNGHRVNLLKNLANRLQTEIYSALNYGDLAKAAALSITIDSLHKLNTAYLNYDCVFIDEACQYLTHLLHSQTCKEHRAQILEVLEYLVYNAALVVIADAHMDDVTVDFFKAMRPKGEEPYIIKNEWKNGGRPIYWYEGQDSSALVAKISSALMAGQKIMVVSDSKRFIKKLEKSLTVKFCPVPQGERETDGLISKELNIWAVHSENSGSEENVAFIKDITNAVKNIDALLTSPSLGTGVDLPDYHFDIVFGVFHSNSQTATECAQHLYRYRPIVPMHVWVAPKPPFGYKDTNPTKIKERLLQTNEITAFLIRIDRETGKRGVEKDWALDAHVALAAARNQSLNNLRADLRGLLADMGNQIIPIAVDYDEISQKELFDAASAMEAEYCASVAGAKDLTEAEYRSRLNKDYLSPEEIFECEKFRIKDAYGMSVTEELVKKDNNGKLNKALASLEAILAPPDGEIADPNTGRIIPLPPKIVADRDLRERDRIPLCFDWKNYSASWLARHILGLPAILKRLIDGEEMTASDPELVQMAKIAQQHAVHIKAILGFTVPPNCSPRWLLAILLDQLGLKLVERKVGPRGEQVRHFSLSQKEKDFALAVLKHRENKRALKEERSRKASESRARSEAGRLAQYGIAPPVDPVSNPPPFGIEKPLESGVDTGVEKDDFTDFEPEDSRGSG